MDQKGSRARRYYCYLYLGYCYENGAGVAKNLEKAYSYYKQSADLGLAFSFVALSRCYKSGIEIDKSNQKAFEYALKGMTKNIPDACYLLGLYYEYGTNTKIDYAKAIECYEKALSLNIENPREVYFYEALCYDNLGKPVKAVEYYKMAGALGSIEAQYNLAIHYLDGDGVSRNLLQAKTLLKKCALQNESKEIKRLANEKLSKMK